MKEELMSFYELPEDNIKSLEQAIKNDYPDIAHLVNFNELIPVMYYNFINKSGITEGVCNDEFVNAGNSASPSSFDFFMEKFYLMELKSAGSIENVNSHADFRKRLRFWML